jgi:starch phosphorylase
VHHFDWDKAWFITQNTFAYTNHTLLPEALEKWPLSIFGRLFPRLMEIIYEINHRFLDKIRIIYPQDDGKMSRLSIIDESGEKYVRMAHLACVGSQAINGVAALHTELLKRDVLRDFYELFPEKFSNKTNGVTPRRWIVSSNPRLTFAINEKIGENWIKHLEDLRGLENYVDDGGFRDSWRRIKYDIKADLANYIDKKVGIKVDPSTLFDVQVKRIHEYKRQHLNVLHIVTLYHRLKNNPNLDITPRTFIFGGKAAPGYFMAKLIIKLINSVAEVIDNDPTIGGRLKVVFLPDYNVTFGQRVYPAADLSEQISTAGKEASGTGNMKFSMNGALTIGTLDGANIEIREEVGAENFFLFGLTTEEVYAKKAAGYNPQEYYYHNEELRAVLDLIGSGFFSRGDSSLFRPLVDNLIYNDPYMLLADYQSYIDCQEGVGHAYKDQEHWSRLAILNVARMGKFSSDRSIQEYCEKIWRVQPVKIELPDYTQANAGLSVN